jgi:hypothetical protein
MSVQLFARIGRQFYINALLFVSLFQIVFWEMMPIFNKFFSNQVHIIAQILYEGKIYA